MNTRPLMAALGGGLVSFVLGYVLYVVVLGVFFENNAGTAVGALRVETGNLMLHAILAGEIVFAYLLVLIFQRTGVAGSPLEGAKAGAIVGLLIGLGINLVQYGSLNIGTFTAHAVDPWLYAARFATAGAVIAFILSRGEPT